MILKDIKKVALFSAPLALSELAYISMVFTDTFLFSLLGVETLAGAGLGTSMLHFMTIVFLGLVAGVSNLVSIAYGAKKNDDINTIVQAGIFISVILFCLVLLIVAMSPHILKFLGQSDDMIVNAYAYMSVAVWSVLPLLLLRVFRGLSIGIGHRLSILKVSVLGTVLNLPLSYWLMSGGWFMPPLGVRGVGIATSCVALCMCSFLAFDIFRNQKFKYFRFWLVQLSTTRLRKAIRNVLHMGFPIGIAYGMEAGLFAVAGLFAGQIGANALAAHHIALQCSIVAFRIPASLAQGTSVLVGQSFGAQRYDMVKRYILSGLTLGMLFSIISSSVFLMMPQLLVKIFTLSITPNEIIITNTAISLLAIAAAFQLADGWQVIAMGALRGLGQANKPTLLTISGYWLVGLPIAYLLKSHIGVEGVWWGLTWGLVATSLLLLGLLIYIYNQLARTPS